MTKNGRFCVYGRFYELCRPFWGSGVIYKAHDTQYMFERHDQKLFIFVFIDAFVSYCPQFWGFGVIYKAQDTQYIFERRDQKLVVFCILGPFSWAIAHSFGVPELFIRSMTLSTCLRGMTKNSSFLRFRAIFLSYCPLFGVPWRFTRNMSVCTF
jgi:hypothetical protein